MSGALGGIADYGMMGRLVSQAGTVRQRLDTLNQQASTGLIANSYAGLGSGAAVSLDLRPALASQQSLQDGIDATTGRMQVSQTALTQIQQIATDLKAKLNGLNGTSADTTDSTAAWARQSLQQMAGLLNTTDGDTYVFAGQDTANRPVPSGNDILSSGFYLQINAAVAGLGTSATAVTTATLAVAVSNTQGVSPFSPALSQQSVSLPTVETGDGQRVSVGVSASANGFVTSNGTSTTGSYFRDVLRALATVGSLNGGQTAAGGFQDLVQDTRTSLDGAISAMAEDAGVLGDRQTALAATKTRLGETATALTTQVSAAEDVDMAATLSQITLTQTQLQSSYELIAGLTNLSLVKFLTS